MADNPHWESQLRDFLRRAGDELKKTGDAIRAEAQELVGNIKDPERQERVKAKLRDLGTWARATAEEVGTLLNNAAGKAETGFRSAAERVQESAAGVIGKVKETVGARDEGSARPPRPPPPPPESSGPKKAASKTVGRRPSGGGKKSSGGGTKKTIGRKK